MSAAKGNIGPRHGMNRSGRKHIYKTVCGEKRCISCMTAPHWPLAEFGCGSTASWTQNEIKRARAEGRPLR